MTRAALSPRAHRTPSGRLQLRPSRRRTILVGLVAAASLVAAPGALARRHHHPPSHLLVYAQEWSLWPSRTSLPAGKIRVELWNRGQDSHDLRVRRLNSRGKMVGRVLGSVRITHSGQIRKATWHLRAGRYEIYCSLPGHLDLGMHTTLRVRKRSR